MSDLSITQRRLGGSNDSRSIYCHFCGFEHMSRHKHLCKSVLLPSLMLRFPSEATMFQKLIDTGKNAEFCCHWMAEDHTQRSAGSLDNYAARPPSRAAVVRVPRRASWSLRGLRAADDNDDDGDDADLGESNEKDVPGDARLGDGARACCAGCCVWTRSC